jgi:hypothetical protein
MAELIQVGLRALGVMWILLGAVIGALLVLIAQSMKDSPRQ